MLGVRSSLIDRSELDAACAKEDYLSHRENTRAATQGTTWTTHCPNHLDFDSVLLDVHMLIRDGDPRTATSHRCWVYKLLSSRVYKLNHPETTDKPYGPVPNKPHGFCGR